MTKNEFNQISESVRYQPDTSGYNCENAPDLIQRRAYQLFEARGRQPGHELDDWLAAERETKNSTGC